MAGVLYAIASPIASSLPDALPAGVIERVRTLRHFVAEDLKTARRLLGDIGMPVPLRELDIRELSEHTRPGDVPPLLEPLRQGRDLGLLSEAGCPGIADPGALLVEAAHKEGFMVRPLVGPSSIVLALMASGFEGQRFAFCGYLPREGPDRERRIRELEQRSRRERETQIFIETPYRNAAMVEALLKACTPSTRLCFAGDLTGPQEQVVTGTAGAMRATPPDLGRRPTVFLIEAG